MSIILGKNPYYNREKSHHTPTGFKNTEPFAIPFNTTARWMFQRLIKRLPHPPQQGYQAFIQQWWQPADFSGTENKLWWLGHATLLIRIQGITILTDPIFSNYASPIQLLGSRRIVPPAATIAQLPPIDVIAISHDHYDHLDYPSVRLLLRHSPQVTMVVPLGLKKRMQRWGAKRILEMDWWQQEQIGPLNITCTPARHWSQRTPFNRNKSLWCSWLFQSLHQTLFFMGDSGYSSSLAQISQRIGAVDLAALSIGAYSPRWMMQNQHIDPFEAAQLFKDLQCRQAVAIHWGTFEMADEALDQPPLLLAQALNDYNISPEEFLVKPIGSSITF